MRRPRRLVIAAALLAGGTGAAFFSLSSRPGNVMAPPASSRVPKSPQSLGPLPLALPEEPPARAQLTGQIEPDEPAGDSPAVDRFADESPANLSAAPDDRPAPSETPWRPSTRAAWRQPDLFPARPSSQVEAKTEPKQRPAVVLHRIADGDTLSGLALKYLGSSQRFVEIFEANREQLPSPDLLPIGAVLRIPLDQGRAVDRFFAPR